MAKKNKSEKVDLSKNLEKLSAIADWFDEQDEVDVEEGLIKVKEAAQLIKDSKGRLKEIENEFIEIKKNIEGEIGEDDGDEKKQNQKSVNTEDLPF